MLRALQLRRAAHQIHAAAAAATCRAFSSPSSSSTFHDALLLDCAGTLIKPAESTAKVYLRHAQQYGCSLTEEQILSRFRISYNTPWAQSALRYVGDGRPFWKYIVAQSTGCSDAALSEALYQHYAEPSAWVVAPSAVSSLQRIRDAGVKTAVVSNFDLRLRPLLEELGLDRLFDAVMVSAEVGAEKPNPVIFEAACAALSVDPAAAVHVGDDRRNDLYGARDAGCHAWLWGLDVMSMDEVAQRVIEGSDEEWELRAIVGM